MFPEPSVDVCSHRLNARATRSTWDEKRRELILATPDSSFLAFITLGVMTVGFFLQALLKLKAKGTETCFHLSLPPPRTNTI